MNYDRTKIIGGSDVAAIMGLNPYKTPLALWAEKTGRLQNDLSNFEAAEIGTELEEYVARKFTKKTGIKLRVDNRTFVHPTNPYMVAHIDRWVVGSDALFEAKTASAYLEKKWAGEEIPLHYVLQVSWYLGIVGKTTGYIAVLIGGQKFLQKEITFDQDLFDKQVEAAKDFWENYVLTDTAPMAMAGDSDTLFGLYPEAKAEIINLEGEKSDALNELVESRSGALESKSHCEEELEKIDAQIKQIIGESEAVQTDKYVATWKNQTRSSVDTEVMKAEGIFDKYKKVTSFRTLRTTERKK